MRVRLERVTGTRLRLIAALLGLPLAALLAAGVIAARSAGEPSYIVYSYGSVVELPSWRTLGKFRDFRRQGGGIGFSPDLRRAYLLDSGPDVGFFSELELPSMRVLRRAELADAIAGTADVVAVSPDGRSVYVETMRIVGPGRWDDRLRRGQPDAEYGVAVYDVEQGAFVRTITLDPPWCGVASLHALPDGQLVVFCPTAQEVRLVDPAQGKQTATVRLGDPPRAGNMPGWAIRGVPSQDGHRFWVVRDTGALVEIDLESARVAREGDLGGDGGQWVPFQRPRLSADGRRLFVAASPGDAEARARGLGTVMWVADVGTLRRVAEVPLPAPASRFAPTPDGRALIVHTGDRPDEPEWGTHLIEVPSGRELRFWREGLAPILVQG